MDSFLARVVVALVAALCLTPAVAQADEPTGGALAQVPTPTPTPTATPEATAPATPVTPAAAPAPKAKKVTVKQIQKALGFKRPDGILGPKTKKALKRFQKRKGLRADGVPRRATLVALGLLPAPQPLVPGSLPAPVEEVLAEIAQCESGGDPTAVSSSGKHRGKYQFTQATWEDLGGSGDPALAAEPLQDTLAAQLYAEQGLKPWPTCGKQITVAEQQSAAGKKRA